MEFVQTYKDDDACLEWLWRNRYAQDGKHAHCPKCDQEREFKKYVTKQRRQSWTCIACGQHVHPTAGTIFEGSSTSLHLWFYAMYLMASTRCGISAKQLERELGVTYKTAWRMMNLIRNQLMVQDDAPLEARVEADETWIGGKPRAADIRRARESAHPEQAKQIWRQKKTAVFGAVQRQGQVRAIIIPDSSAATLRGTLTRFVLPASTIYTDEWNAYVNAGKLYKQHLRIPHNQNIYVMGDVHTNTIEGFFSLVKNGIRGVYHSVSDKWLQGYLNEYAWRYNHRPELGGPAMFEVLMQRAASRP
jgi:transposase